MPLLCRPDNGRYVEVNGSKLDNRWVVPYNPALSLLLDCHVNTESSTGFRCVKYVFKYVTKGHDCCVAELRSSTSEAVDEISEYMNARQVFLIRYANC